MSKRDMKRAFQVFLGTVLLAIVAAGVMAIRVYRYPHIPQNPGSPRAITIPKGSSLVAVVALLEREGVIRNSMLFRFYANRRGIAGKVKAGHYQFAAGSTAEQVCDQLVAGPKEEQVALTIPEGKNMLDVAQLLEAAKICPAKEFLKSARDLRRLAELGIRGLAAEGYLFPDTYRFRVRSPAPTVLAAMVHRFNAVFDELRKRHADGIHMLERTYGFDDRDIVILASIVEKETGAPKERPRIASVFLNRLRFPTFKPKVLQTDPTIIYGCTALEAKSVACQKFEGRIRHVHLVDADNPYNTYTHEGLPPGPISNPGRAALEAVMAPETSDYLYFVSQNDGTHHFSKSKAEHEQAVNRYQRGIAP